MTQYECYFQYLLPNLPKLVKIMLKQPRLIFHHVLNIYITDLSCIFPHIFERIFFFHKSIQHCITILDRHIFALYLTAYSIVYSLI